jgi:transposase
MGTDELGRLVPEGLKLDLVSAAGRELILYAKTNDVPARCPECGTASSRLHSRYHRTVRDLPWRRVMIVLRVRSRKLFCDDPDCERTVFCERLPEVAAYARETDRLEAALLAIAHELGGEAGAKLARKLGLLVSPTPCSTGPAARLAPRRSG